MEIGNVIVSSLLYYILSRETQFSNMEKRTTCPKFGGKNDQN
jgi:hypothetical protein